MTTMIGYLRVSTEEQTTSGLGLEAQREAVQRYADAHGWDVEWYVDEGVSGKTLDRPALQDALARLHPKKRDVDGLLVAKLDRLSRSVGHFGGLLELAHKRGWFVVAIDLGIDTSTASGELVANVMAAVARWERRAISDRTSAALQAAKRRGVKLGRPIALAPASEARVVALRAEGLTLAQISERLNVEGVPTGRPGRWHPSTVQRVLARNAAPAALTAKGPNA